MRKKRTKRNAGHASDADRQRKKFQEELVCKACPHAPRCRGGFCIDPKYRQERIRTLQEFSKNADSRPNAPSAQDVADMSELLKAAASHLKGTVDRMESVLEDEKQERFCRHCRKLLAGELRGTWNVTRCPDGEIGTIYSFVFEGETYMYGWDEDRQKIGFYALPACLDEIITVTKARYMVRSDFTKNGGSS